MDDESRCEPRIRRTLIANVEMVVAKAEAVVAKAEVVVAGRIRPTGGLGREEEEVVRHSYTFGCFARASGGDRILPRRRKDRRGTRSRDDAEPEGGGGGCCPCR
jgi:hypothetical protein